MKKLRIFFSWNTNPLWLYGEDGVFEDDVHEEYIHEDIPELASDPQLVQRIYALQDIYDDLFINTSKVFEYRGFDTKEERLSFYTEVNLVIRELKEKLKGKYVVLDDVDYSADTPFKNDLE